MYFLLSFLFLEKWNFKLTFYFNLNYMECFKYSLHFMLTHPIKKLKLSSCIGIKVIQTFANEIG